MQIEKLITKLVYLNIIVALSTGVLCWGFCHYVQIEQDYVYGAFAFCSTFAVYNAQRIYKSGTLQRTPWLFWVFENRQILIMLVILALIGTGLSLFYILKMDTGSLTLLSLSGLISFFYIVRIGKKNLREQPYIKIHLIAISWAIVLILFPMLNEGNTSDSLIYFAAHYLYVLGVTIPFDIRDLKYDQQQQRTIPQVFGVDIARILSVFLILFFSLLMFYVDQDLTYNPVFYIAVGAQIALAILMNENQSDIYCAGGIDGAISILGLAYLITN